ncbi:MAG: PTS sugar transporter subunit IIA [Pseudomonadales bacterium]
MTADVLLTEEYTLCRIEATSRKRVLEEIANALETPELTSDALFEGLMARERLGSTGLGEGVAIPHCRADVDRITLCLATASEPIDYEASDGQFVDIFVALIVPTDEHEAHLGILAALSTALNEPDNRDSLRACRSSSELCTCLKSMLNS